MWSQNIIPSTCERDSRVGSVSKLFSGVWSTFPDSQTLFLAQFVCQHLVLFNLPGNPGEPSSTLSRTSDQKKNRKPETPILHILLSQLLVFGLCIACPSCSMQPIHQTNNSKIHTRPLVMHVVAFHGWQPPNIVAAVRHGCIH